MNIPGSEDAGRVPARRFLERWRRSGVLLIVLLLIALPLTLAACQETSTGAAAGSATTAPDSTQTTGQAPDQNAATPGAAADLVSPALSVAKNVSPSVVTVFASQVVRGFFGQTQQAQGSGSGVIYSSDGYIVTNNHVVEAGTGQVAQDLTVRLATGEDLPAKLVGRDTEFDLAILKVDRTDLPAANFINDISQVQVGEYAIAIGSPLGASFNNSITLGIVSGVGREIPAPSSQQSSLVDLIQTDAAISPGNSGGALVDAQGRVIGINVAYIQPQAGAQDLGFAIPADVVVDAADQLIKTGSVQHPYIGIGSMSVSDVQGQFDVPVDHGVLVAEVYANTPAAEAGLQRGDVITQMDGKDLNRQADLFSALRRKSPGDTITLTVVRGSQTLDLEVTLGERPTSIQ